MDPQAAHSSIEVGYKVRGSTTPVTYELLTQLRKFREIRTYVYQFIIKDIIKDTDE